MNSPTNRNLMYMERIVVRMLEVCVDSLASARAAVAGGSDRLELCSALAVGGLTPYVQLLRQLRQETDIPVRCLMRPRAGDFLYTREELDMMAEQILVLRQSGAEGFVLGCLDAQGNLDAAAMAPLLEAAKGAGLTLHRCIDVSRDPEACYRDAWALGFDTVLTSGAAASCTNGKSVLSRLLTLQAQGGPTVLIGSGVNAGVIRELRRELPSAESFHMSGKQDIPSGMLFRRENVPMGIPGLDEWHIARTSEAAVRAAKEALREALS